MPLETGETILPGGDPTQKEVHCAILNHKRWRPRTESAELASRGLYRLGIGVRVSHAEEIENRKRGEGRGEGSRRYV